MGTPRKLQEFMSQITIPLSDDKLAKLQETAARLGTTPEILASAGLDEFLARPREDFERALNRVLKKNAELYKRLA
jgi:hypothetical protein